MAKNGRTTTAKRTKAMEMDYWRDEMQRTLKGLVAPAAIFCVQLFVPQRAHVRLPNLVSLIIVLGAQLFTAWALKRTDGYAQTKHMHFMNSIVHHAVRTIAHVVFIHFDHRDMLGQLFFVFVAPCSAARISSYSTFVGFLVVHVMLLLYRFGGSFAEDYPVLITGLACCHILHEISLLKKLGEDNALEKSRDMMSVTENIAEGVLKRFCDATGRIAPDLSFVQESPSLSTLLGRRVHAGRFFTDFMHMGDREQYRGFMQSEIDSVAREEEMHESLDVDHVDGLRLRSIDLYLEDSMNIPFEAHVFHARLENLDEMPVYLIGISERESYKHTQKKADNPSRTRRRRTDTTCLDFESGRLLPSRPAFDTKDESLVNLLDCRQRGYMEREKGSADGGGANTAGRRDGSPRMKASCRAPSPQLSIEGVVVGVNNSSSNSNNNNEGKQGQGQGSVLSEMVDAAAGSAVLDSMKESDKMK